MAAALTFSSGERGRVLRSARVWSEARTRSSLSLVARSPSLNVLEMNDCSGRSEAYSRLVIIEL